MALIPDRNYLEAVPAMSDSDLMAWAAEAMYEEGFAPEAVRAELLDRCYTQDDIEAEYDRTLLARLRDKREAAREQGELMGIEGVA
jgi:hypothetical protein